MSSVDEFPIDNCDVTDRAALVAYRSACARWFEWLVNDPDQSVSTQLSDMLWQDAIFRSFNEARRLGSPKASAARASVLAAFIDRSYVASQVLGISKLLDKRSDVISLQRVLSDIKANRDLLTRQNYLANDGLPYDWHAARAQVYQASEGASDKSVWLSNSGPDAWAQSMSVHEHFDRLAGVLPTERSRNDIVNTDIFDALDRALNSPVFDVIRDMRHKRLAHAADAVSRLQVKSSTSGIRMDDISTAHRTLLQVSQVLQCGILYGGWRASAVPTPQFNQFADLDKPFVSSAHLEELSRCWDTVVDERDAWLTEAFTIVPRLGHKAN